MSVFLQVVEANLVFTGRPCTAVRKEGVVFLTQRRQATSDFRENTMVKLTQDDDDLDDNSCIVAMSVLRCGCWGVTAAGRAPHSS